MQVDVQDKGSSRFLKMDFLIVQPTQNELFSRLSCTGELSTVWLLWGAPAVCSSTAPHVAHFPFVMVDRERSAEGCALLATLGSRETVLTMLPGWPGACYTGRPGPDAWRSSTQLPKLG